MGTLHIQIQQVTLPEKTLYDIGLFASQNDR